MKFGFRFEVTRAVEGADELRAAMEKDAVLAARISEDPLLSALVGGAPPDGPGLAKPAHPGRRTALAVTDTATRRLGVQVGIVAAAIVLGIATYVLARVLTAV